jgi:pyridoxal phosphate enzyme (YggS family)
MSHIAQNLQEILGRINHAVTKARRDSGSVKLLAVSKTQPTQSIRDAISAGQKDFGENYLQEAIEKISDLQEFRSDITWHLIGPLQSNKTRPAAESFDWVQSVDREKIALRLSEQRPDALKPLNVCVQINISGEATKSGITPDLALALCEQVARLPKLSLRGLMAIPEPGAQNMTLAAMKELFESIKAKLSSEKLAPNFDTLSLGMSDDLEEAIAAGSTMVRIGTAIFGKRQQKTT